MKRRQFIKTAAWGLGLAGLGGYCCSISVRPNILFIAVDDLRPELGCYGESHIISPNIDKLAREGVRFENSHCNVPVCGASRASLLTGVRPSPQRFIYWHTWADKDLPGHLSLPRYLKQNGYHTISNGKIYHHRTDDMEAWSEEPWHPKGDWFDKGYLAEETREKIIPNPRSDQPSSTIGPAWETADVDDSNYPDGKIADKSIRDLERLAKLDQPFFLGVGFKKPHLPFNAPKKYWDLYEHDEIQLTENSYIPENAPPESIHNSPELRYNYSGVPEAKPLPDDYAKWLVHGYQACVSYIDALVGRVLDKLKALKLADNTIVIFWGDHGWNLGEHTMWCKHCNYETSLSAPIIVKAPGMESDRVSNALVEFVDIYPSLVELCGLPIPEHCQGSSFVPLLKKPDREWKKATFSRYHQGNTVTTERFQYTEYRDMQTDEFLARMLYDHERDPYENINVAESAEYKEKVEQMAALLQEGWKPHQRQ
ncbi:MAG: sulfatase [candidate division KSB1 bacterium]|nr:sulfatase [candidate division KSB1 bacterium]